MTARLKIGTRGSKLALTQCGMVQRQIVAAMGLDPAQSDIIAPLVIITTQGDRIQDRRLIEAGGKSLFTKEIEDALLRGDIDIAVHSLKDMPADDIPGLTIGAIPQREDPRDAFVSVKYQSLDDLPQGARLGTASLRRQAQALNRRPDLDIVMVRGNVDTRLRKLDEGEVDALLLAAAGLNRMDLSARIRSHIDPDKYPTAPGQGALAIQCRAADANQPWMALINHMPTRLCVEAERGALTALEASCRTAVGAHATLDEQDLHLFVEALSADGRTRWQRRGTVHNVTLHTARQLGLDLGHEIKAEGRPSPDPGMIAPNGIVWITRTREGAERTAAAVAARDYEPLIAPVLEIAPLMPVIDPASFDAVILTSGNAVSAFSSLCARRDLPVWCVGERTAQLAATQGFSNIKSANGDVRALFDLIRTEAPKSQRLLHATPLEPAAPLAQWLSDEGFIATQAPVYETRLIAPEFGDDDLRRITHVLIHSPRAGEAAANTLIARTKNTHSRTLTFICISEAAWRAAHDALAAAEAKIPSGLHVIPRISPFPDEVSMLNLLG